MRKLIGVFVFCILFIVPSGAAMACTGMMNLEYQTSMPVLPEYFAETSQETTANNNDDYQLFTASMSHPGILPDRRQEHGGYSLTAERVHKAHKDRVRVPDPPT